MRDRASVVAVAFVKRPLTAAALLSAIALATAAQAQSTTAAAADALFRRAREDLKAGRTAEACARFAESQKLEPSAGALLNLAECSAREGHLALALTRVEEAVRMLPPGDKRLAFATARRAALDARTPKVTLEHGEALGADTSVAIDRTPLGASVVGVPLPLDPGKHDVTLRDRGVVRTRTFELREGQRLTISLHTLGEASERAGEPSRSDSTTVQPSPAAARRPADGKRIVGFGALGLAVAGVATGIVGGLAATGAASDVGSRCPDRACASQADLDGANADLGRARTWAAVSYVGYGVGLASAGVAAWALLTPSTSREVAVSPSLAPGAAGASLVGRF